MLEDSCRHHIFAWCHAVGKCLRPLDSVHVCRVSPLIAADNSGRLSQSLGYRHAADIRPEQLLEVLCERLDLLCVDLLPALREVFILIIKFNTLLSDIPVLVPALHSVHIFFKADKLIFSLRLTRFESQEFL